MNRQIPLSIQLNDEATLDDFNWGDNQILQQQLDHFLTQKNQLQFLYIWGIPGCGKSHLLQACCQAIANRSAIYLPLDTLINFSPEVLDGIEGHALICIDDMETIAGLPAWEEGLLHLYNRIRDNPHGKLIMTGNMAPTNMTIQLADLKSRLSWDTVFQLHELNDDNKIETLQRHAQKRGFEIPTPVGQFLINRCARNMHDLQTLLNQLDETSLAAQRKITIPFVKQALNL
jgi:DnaA family protein